MIASATSSSTLLPVVTLAIEQPQQALGINCDVDVLGLGLLGGVHRGDSYSADLQNNLSARS